jgi:hypothetical protein
MSGGGSWRRRWPDRATVGHCPGLPASPPIDRSIDLHRAPAAAGLMHDRCRRLVLSRCDHDFDTFGAGLVSYTVPRRVFSGTDLLTAHVAVRCVLGVNLSRS